MTVIISKILLLCTLLLVVNMPLKIYAGNGVMEQAEVIVLMAMAAKVEMEETAIQAEAVMVAIATMVEVGTVGEVQLGAERMDKMVKLNN